MKIGECQMGLMVTMKNEKKVGFITDLELNGHKEVVPVVKWTKTDQNDGNREYGIHPGNIEPVNQYVETIVYD